MKSTSFEDAIKQIVQHTLKLPDREIAPNTNLRDLPGVESIKILRIVASIEKAFDVRLDDQIVFRVNTIEELATEVGKLVVEPPTP